MVSASSTPIRDRAAVGAGGIPTPLSSGVHPATQRGYDCNQKGSTLSSVASVDRLSHGSPSVCIHGKESSLCTPPRLRRGFPGPFEDGPRREPASGNNSFYSTPWHSPSELELSRLLNRLAAGGCCGFTTAVYLKLPLGVFSWQMFVDRLAITQLRSVIRGL